MGNGKRRFLTGTCLFLAGFAALPAAHAGMRACQQLEARLAALQLSDNGEMRSRYERAVVDQASELATVRKQARRLGCGSASGFGSAECPALDLQIERMEANLSDLTRKRNVLTWRATGNENSQRAGIEAQMASIGCVGDRYAAQPSERDDRDLAIGTDELGVFQRLERSEIEYSIDPEHAGNIVSVPSAREEDSIKAYRTMCVRTCDGYYFPMSPSSSRNDFARDQQNCESVCPGTEMRIYYQPSRQSDVATMRSAASGERYPDLPAAYSYRRADVSPAPACGCGRSVMAENYSIIAGEGSTTDEERQATPVVPDPWQRPDAETVANADGRITAQQTVEMGRPEAASRPLSASRRIRVVGPTFFPGQTAAKAPQVQDRTRDR